MEGSVGAIAAAQPTKPDRQRGDTLLEWRWWLAITLVRDRAIDGVHKQQPLTEPHAGAALPDALIRRVGEAGVSATVGELQRRHHLMDRGQIDIPLDRRDGLRVGEGWAGVPAAASREATAELIDKEQQVLHLQWAAE